MIVMVMVIIGAGARVPAVVCSSLLSHTTHKMHLVLGDLTYFCKTYQPNRNLIYHFYQVNKVE